MLYIQAVLETAVMLPHTAAGLSYEALSMILQMKFKNDEIVKTEIIDPSNPPAGGAGGAGGAAAGYGGKAGQRKGSKIHRR